jgi:hypothetical protein
MAKVWLRWCAVHVTAEASEAVYFTQFQTVHKQKDPAYIGRSVLTKEGRYTKWTLDDGQLVTEELYDHRSDLRETRNVIDAKDSQDIREKLRHLWY